MDNTGSTMKYYGYKVLLFFLRGLVSLKKGFFRFGRLFLPFIRIFGSWYQKVIRFRLFKLGFLINRKLQRYKISKENRFVDIISSRFFLQCLFLLVVLCIALPQSKLYSADKALLTSHETLLYTLIGPGDQDFDSQEVIVSSGESPSLDMSNQGNSWDTGALGANNVPQFNDYRETDQQDLASISAGGSALLKPSIPTGASLPTEAPALATNTGTGTRTKALEYEVQSGDVISTIASRFGLKVNSLLLANNLSARSLLRPGDKLSIPPGDGAMYTVKRGDTLGRIAKQFGVDQSEIIAFNNMAKDGASISIGQDIFIPGAQIVPTQKVNLAVAPPSKITETIRKIAAPPPSLDTPAGSGYVWPTKDHKINQYYGLRHTGVDIHGVIGNPNYAARAGTVIKSQCGWNGGYGCYIILSHGNGVTTLYGHNSKLLVSVGDEVKQGQVIGLLGSTGRSTGPHLHFEVRVNNKRSNPLQYIR